jgi:hypothetical protein
VLLTGLAERLAQSFDVVTALPEGRKVGGALQSRSESLAFPLEDQGGRAYQHYRQRLGDAHIWRANPAVANAMSRLRRYRRPFLDRLNSFTTDWRARLEASPKLYWGLVDRVSKLEQEMTAKGPIVEWLRATRCRAALFTAPELAIVRPLAHAAQQLGLRTIAMIHSFDNLSTKGRHSVVFDAYLVWSADMKAELLHVYPEIRESDIHIAGTTHFHFYASPRHQTTRTEVSEFLGLDPSRPIVLYAAGPDALLPFEVPVVERLARDLADVALAERPQVVVRLHPFERDSERWKALAARAPQLVWSVPWETSAADPSWAAPTDDDLRAFCGLVRHADVVVNAASTMSLEAAICDRPAICVDYCLPPFEDFASHLHAFYDYFHYRPITESGAVRIAHSPGELVAQIVGALRVPKRDQSQRAALVRRMCAVPPAEAVESVASAIERAMLDGSLLA